MIDLFTYRQKLDRFLTQRSLASASVQREKTELKQAELRANCTERAQQIIQIVAQKIQKSAHNQIALVVSRCLETVFEQPYRFNITFERKRGQTEAKITFARGGLELDPRGATGGGVIDVASFALRLACLILAKPARRRFLEIDEPFGRVKPPEVYGPKIVEMIETLASDLGIQFLLVPSIEAHYEVGQVVRVGK